MDQKAPLRTILLVEDDEEIRSLMRAFLQHSGYAVLSCHNAQLAAEVFRTRPNIDLLLTDINMPDGSGLELAHELTTGYPQLPVILISGDSLNSERAQQIASRSWHFVQKPASLPYLLDLIHTSLTSPIALQNTSVSASTGLHC